MSLADIFKRKPKQLDADPEDGDGSEMMAGNEAVRKKQILLMSGGAAIALVLGSWYIMDDDKAELVTDASGKETRIATDDMVNKNMSQREWQAASEAQMQSMNNQLKSVDGQAAQMRALAAELPSALLCYERDPCHCHRTLLLQAEGEGAEVVDLYT